MNNLSYLISQARIDGGKTQEQIAEIMGVSRSTIQNWEKGNSLPDLDEFGKLCEAAGVNPVPYVLQFYCPLEFEGITGRDEDLRIRNALKLLADNLPIRDCRGMLYVLYGNHGSSQTALIQMMIAHLQTPMANRVIDAKVVADHYEFAEKLGFIVNPENIQPDMNILRQAIKEATDAVFNKESGYFIQKDKVSFKL